jgi:hypothetical protein
MKKSTLLVALFLIIASASTAFAGNGAINTWVEECGEYYSACCDMDITYCIDVHVQTDKNGNLSHLNLQGTGTGEDGSSWVITGSRNYNGNADGNGADNATTVIMQRINDTGTGDCGESVKILFHVTVNADGTVTSEIEVLEFECENGTTFE